MERRRYIEIFVREAEDLLQQLRQGLVALEKNGFSVEQVDDLLRHAHTLKGSARMLGLDLLGEVGHRMEDRLKEISDKERPLTPELVDVLLLGTDALEALTAQAHSGGEIDVNVDHVMEALDNGEMPSGSVVIPRPEKERETATVRASVARLDQLVNLLGEVLTLRRMLVDKNSSFARLHQRLEGFMQQLNRANNYLVCKEIADDLSRATRDLERDTLSLHYLSEELHDTAMELRMLPLSTITDDLERMVRDLARQQEKEVDFVLEGGEVELDRMMLEALRPMLLHMLRNAIDHGLESPEERILACKETRGTLSLAARYEGSFVLITLRDDGRGIDPVTIRRVAVERGLLGQDEATRLSDEETIYLILRPGFSTREEVTEISGRGVGMDVVKNQIDRVKGNLVIHSQRGEGSEMRLKLPLTMAIITAMLIRCGEQTYAVPLHYVAEVLRLGANEIQREGGREVVRVREKTLPLIALSDLLGITPQNTAETRRVTVLVLSFREQQLACLVDSSLETCDLIVKELGKQLKSVRFVSGATILADGDPALILSVPDIFQSALSSRGTRLLEQFANAQEQRRKGWILVVDDSITTRTMEKNILETHGYQVSIAVSGEDALAILETRDFDLVVSDVEMPGISGFDLTAQLRRSDHTRDLPVVIVTSLASDEDRRRGLEVGAQAYIVKGSFDQGTLLDAVENLIG